VSDPFTQASLALLLLRVGTGVIFIPPGYLKMSGRGNQEKHGHAHQDSSAAPTFLSLSWSQRSPSRCSAVAR
jgi:uncharacterized membrane protein YphA (DoxX/SURF4 family)